MAKESTLKNMVITLSVITLISSALMGVVYSLTKEPIETALASKTNSAIAGVAPAFDNEPSLEKSVVEFGGKNYTVYPAKSGGVITGYAIETFASGFGGTISLIVGFDTTGTINGVAVLSHAETPGLGDKIDPLKSNFSVQFKGKNPENFQLSVKKDGGDVDAITASTITSRAYCVALSNAYQVFIKCNQNRVEEASNE